MFVLGGEFYQELNPSWVCPSPRSLVPVDSGQQRFSNKRSSLFPIFVSFLHLSVPVLEECPQIPIPKLLFPPCFVPQIPFPPVWSPSPHPTVPPLYKPPPPVLPPKPLLLPHFPTLLPSVPGHSLPRQGLVLQAMILPWSPRVTQPPHPHRGSGHRGGDPLSWGPPWGRGDRDTPAPWCCSISPCPSPLPVPGMVHPCSHAGG